MAERDAVVGQWDPEVRLRDLEADGVAAEVVFPQGSVPFHKYPANTTVAPDLEFPADLELQKAGCRAYNRWLAELCSAHPGRTVGVAVVPIRDLESAIAEVEWAREAGLSSVSLPPISDAFPMYNDPVYERFWAACAAAEMPLNVHGASGQCYGTGPETLAIMFAECDFFNRRALWFLTFSGVFERHPGLQLVFTEQRAGWVAPTLDLLDSIHGTPISGIAAVLPRRPSEYFATNCWVGASILSRAEAELRYEIGVDRMMFGADFPHVEGAWGQTAEYLRATVGHAGMTIPEARKFLGATAADVFGFDARALLRQRPAERPHRSTLRPPRRAAPDGSCACA